MSIPDQVEDKLFRKMLQPEGTVDKALRAAGVET